MRPRFPLSLLLIASLQAALLAPLASGDGARTGADSPRADGGPVLPISEGERAAVELALAYAVGGPDAWRERLDPASPLAALPPDEARAAVEARAGSPEGAVWTLQTRLAPPARAGNDDGAGAKTHRASASEAVHFHLLFPSGADELLTLELVRRGEEWLLLSLRSWAEPTEAPGQAASGPSAGSGTVGGGSDHRTIEAGGASLESASLESASLEAASLGWGAAGVLLIASLLLLPRRRGLAFFSLAGALLVGGLLGSRGVPLPVGLPETLLAARDGEELNPAEPRRPEAGGGDREDDGGGWEALAELRRAVARGDDLDHIGQLAAELRAPAAGEAGRGGGNGRGRRAEMARLWQAQALLAAGEADEAGRLLESKIAEVAVPEGAEVGAPDGARSEAPLAALLAGRLALTRGADVETAYAYGRALEALPPVDGPRLEAAEAFLLAGFDARASGLLEELAAGGSRLARPRYLLARFAALSGEPDAAPDAAVELLRSAWSLEPLERGDLVGEQVYAHLVRRGGLFEMLRLGEAEEPAAAAPDTGAFPLTPPPGFRAAVLGASLRFSRALPEGGRAGEGWELYLPGGSSLAPAWAEIETAPARRKREEARALADLEGLTDATRSPGAFAQPALRGRVETAAEALARQGRWTELLALTQRPAASPERLPASLASLRAEALRRSGRQAEATSLLIAVARHDIARGRSDPQPLFQLADLLDRSGEHELAIKVMSRAEALAPRGAWTSEVPRMQMERRLEKSYGTYQTRHFRVRYPASTPPPYVIALTRVLEDEVRRIHRWIPYPPSERVEVNLYPYREFFRLYSQGGQALGLFDGEVRVPLAEVSSLSPFVVAILSHEVAHAMIADATGDRAPSWLHEGLAQHIQMLQNRVNPIPDYQRAGKLLGFPLLEPILAGRSEPELVSLAYDQAAWTAHFLEAREGPGVFRRLLAAYAEGAGDEEALAEVLGLSPAELDDEFRHWAGSEAPATWPTRLVRYDLGERP